MHPFLFVGQGFATSHKCLEGHLWFEQPPSETEREWVRGLVPEPIAMGVRFVDALMHFGSDDLLEARVKAVYAPEYASMKRDEALRAIATAERNADGTDETHLPTRAEWAAFCAEFERAVVAIHERCKLQLVLKPDDGAYGKELGAWHDWSLTEAHRVAERALRDARPASRDLSYLAANLVNAVLRGATSIDAIAEPERRTWLAWLDRLVSESPPELRGRAFATFVSKIASSFPDDRRDEIHRALRPETIAVLHEETERARRVAERRAKRNAERKA